MKKLIGLVLIWVAVFLGASLAHAGTVTLSWIAPTTRTDGTPLTNLASYNVYRGTSATTLVKVTSVAAPAITYDDTVPGGATYFYAMTAVDSNQIESAQSNVVSKAVPAAPPSAPTGLTLTVQVADNNAYKMRQTVDDYSFVSIGTVPIGTSCNTAHSNDGYSLVDRNVVALASKFDTLPLLVFAKCA